MINTNLEMKEVLYFTGFCWGWRGGKALIDRTFPPPKPSQSTLYITTNMSDGWGGDLVQITNTFTPCQEPTLTTGQSNPLLIVSPSPVHLFPLYSLQGEWNSEAGRGVQCVLSKFRMYFRALETRRRRKKKKKDRGWRRNGE